LGFNFRQNIFIVEHCIASKYFVLQSKTLHSATYIEYRTGHK